MGLYSGFKYSTEKYGRPPKFAYSVEPFTAQSLWYDKVSLSWAIPTGNYKAIRLLRNQNNYPETEEDGVIIWEWQEGLGGEIRATFIDGEDNLLDVNTGNDYAFVKGRMVYYRIWIWTDTDVWIAAGDTEALIPNQHSNSEISGENTHVKLMGLIPRVFTTPNQSPYGEIDYNSELSTFLQGFSFTLDEFLTYADLIQPNFMQGISTPALSYLRSLQLGLPSDSTLITGRQERLIREAVRIYQRKGTKTALSALVESLTGFAPTLTDSPNILLSSEDSSFTGGVGSWVPTGGVTIAVENTIRTPDVEVNSIDQNNCAKVVVPSTGGTLGNGSLDPVTTATPVNPGTEYTLSFYVEKLSGSTPTITPKITWYNYLGEALSTVTGSAETVSTTWAKKTFTAFAPGYTGTISALAVSSNVATVTTTTKHHFQVSDSVTIFDGIADLNGTYTVTAVTDYSFSFAYTSDDFTDIPVEASVRLASWTFDSQAVYASIELAFSATAGTVYLDLIQLAESSTTSFYEARGIEIFLEPKKTNYLVNPSFANVGTAWDITSASHTHATSDLIGVYSGDTMLEVVTTTGGLTEVSSTTIDSAEVGKFYTFSIYAKTGAGTESFDLFVSALNASTSAVVVTRAVSVEVTTTWTRFSVNLYIPASSPEVVMQVGITGSTTGETVFLEAAQLEKTFTATDYFDGSLPSDSGALWAGTANDSISYYYPQKRAKMQRVLADIEDYLPLGTPYSIYSYAGLEGSGIA
jgi:hypothetical protein